MALNYSDKLERIHKVGDIKDMGSKVLATNESLTEPLVFDIYQSIYSKIAASLTRAESMQEAGTDAILTVGALEQLMSNPRFHLKGIQGIQSTQGIQGLQGPKGKNNIIADAGAQGIQGPIGADAIITKGDTGIQGLQGVQGLSPDTVSIANLVGFDDLTDATCDANGNYYKILSKGIPGGPNILTGPQGVQGPKLCVGATGLQGFPGENIEWRINGRGVAINPLFISKQIEMVTMDFNNGNYYSFWGDYVQGVQGAIGITYQGIQGDQGPQGDKGSSPVVDIDEYKLRYKGPRGPQGEQGNKGIQGPKGRNGLNGNNVSILQTITPENEAIIMDEIKNSFRNLGIIIDNQYIEFNI